MLNEIIVMFLLEILLCVGLVVNASASGNQTSITTNATIQRSGRNYDSQTQISRYSADSALYAATEDDSNGNSKYNLPTSFDDFMPGGKQNKKPRYGYPQYYAMQGAPYKGMPVEPLNWKGDSGDDAAILPFMPTPAELMMAINMFKDMNGDAVSDSTDDQPTGLLGKLAAEPVAVVVAIMLPITILLAAVIPTLVSFLMGSGSDVIPTITTVATGNSGRGLRSDNPSFITPIIETIEKFSGRSLERPTCIQKAFCEATMGGNGTDFRPIQKNIYKAFTFIDDYWLETLGIKGLMDAMGNGDCGKIRCNSENKYTVSQKKYASEPIGDARD